MEHNSLLPTSLNNEVSQSLSSSNQSNSVSSSISPNHYYEYSGTEEDDALGAIESVSANLQTSGSVPSHTFNLLFAEQNNTSLWNQYENDLQSKLPESLSQDQPPPLEEHTDEKNTDKPNLFGYDFQTILKDGPQSGKLVFLQFPDYHQSEYGTRGLMPIHAIRVCDANRFMVLLNGDNKFWMFEKYHLFHHDPKCDYYHTLGDLTMTIEFSLFLKPLQISNELECIGTGILRHPCFIKGFRFVASPKNISFLLDHSLANQQFKDGK
jgi:hypothetical protein